MLRQEDSEDEERLCFQPRETGGKVDNLVGSPKDDGERGWPDSESESSAYSIDRDHRGTGLKNFLFGGGAGLLGDTGQDEQRIREAEATSKRLTNISKGSEVLV